MGPVSLNALVAGVAMSFAGLALAQPEYLIVDMGRVSSADSVAQGLGISPGGVAVGRSVGSSNSAFTWTESGGLAALGNLPGRVFNQANSANAVGQAVGTATSTLFGSSPLPVLWNGTTPTQLALPAGEGAGRAWGINNAGVAVGSVGGGTTQFASVWQGGAQATITATTPGGAFMVEAFGVNTSNLVAGFGLDPLNAARNVGLVYDLNSNTMMEIPALPGRNGAIAFAISDGGFVTGSSSQNQASGPAFLWDAVNGSRELPLPTGTTTASGRGVNSAGWVVGNAGGQFSVPWLFDGVQTYRLQDLIDPASGWDLSMNTSSSALGISENGTIVGTGLLNGQLRAYAAILIPAPGSLAVLLGAGVVASRRRR